VKGLLQLSTFSRGVSALFVKLAILPGILWLRGCGHRRRSSKNGTSSNLHEDASGVSGKSGVDRLELRHPLLRAGIFVTTIYILIPQDLSLLRGVGIVDADLGGSNEVCGLPQGLGQCHLLLFSQGKLEMATLKTVQEGDVCHPVPQVWNQHCLLMEAFDKLGEELLWPLLDF